jgi:hypothetical protein
MSGSIGVIILLEGEKQKWEANGTFDLHERLVYGSGCILLMYHGGRG